MAFEEEISFMGDEKNEIDRSGFLGGRGSAICEDRFGHFSVGYPGRDESRPESSFGRKEIDTNHLVGKGFRFNSFLHFRAIVCVALGFFFCKGDDIYLLENRFQMPH